ncbi:MAG: DMT family transporter, partial [Candidatus Methylomirabilales bacterium]
AIVPLGALLVGASAASLASVMLKLGPRQPSLGANAVGAAVGFVICLAVSLGAREPWVIPRTIGQLFPILYLTLAGSVGAYVLMAWLVNRWEVTRISFIAVIIPAIGLVLGWLVRHERLEPVSAIGAVLVICGVFLALQADRRRKKSQPQESHPRPA